MKNKKLYPELADYIFDFCSNYFLEKELIAHKHLHALSKSNKGENIRLYKFFMKEENVYSDQEIMLLVKDGFDEFKRKVVERIFNEYGYSLHLNLCPKCDKIARTPLAKQCRFCQNDWH